MLKIDIMEQGILEKQYMKLGLPQMRPGDIVRVHQRIKEGEKTRVAKFEGMIIARKHGNGMTGTFTVRKVIQEIGVERIFPLHSPLIEKIEVVSRPSRVRRAKLYYIREKAARVIRKKMRQIAMRSAAAEPSGIAEETAAATPESSVVAA